MSINVDKYPKWRKWLKKYPENMDVFLFWYNYCQNLSISIDFQKEPDELLQMLIVERGESILNKLIHYHQKKYNHPDIYYHVCHYSDCSEFLGQTKYNHKTILQFFSSFVYYNHFNDMEKDFFKFAYNVFEHSKINENLEYLFNNYQNVEKYEIFNFLSNEYTYYDAYNVLLFTNNKLLIEVTDTQLFKQLSSPAWCTKYNFNEITNYYKRYQLFLYFHLKPDGTIEQYGANVLLKQPCMFISTIFNKHNDIVINSNIHYELNNSGFIPEFTLQEIFVTTNEIDLFYYTALNNGFSKDSVIKTIADLFYKNKSKNFIFNIFGSHIFDCFLNDIDKFPKDIQYSILSHAVTKENLTEYSIKKVYSLVLDNDNKTIDYKIFNLIDLKDFECTLESSFTKDICSIILKNKIVSSLPQKIKLFLNFVRDNYPELVNINDIDSSWHVLIPELVDNSLVFDTFQSTKLETIKMFIASYIVDYNFSDSFIESHVEELIRYCYLNHDYYIKYLSSQKEYIFDLKSEYISLNLFNELYEYNINAKFILCIDYFIENILGVDFQKNPHLNAIYYYVVSSTYLDNNDHQYPLPSFINDNNVPIAMDVCLNLKMHIDYPDYLSRYSKSNMFSMFINDLYFNDSTDIYVMFSLYPDLFITSSVFSIMYDKWGFEETCKQNKNSLIYDLKNHKEQKINKFSYFTLLNNLFSSISSDNIEVFINNYLNEYRIGFVSPKELSYFIKKLFPDYYTIFQDILYNRILYKINNNFLPLDLIYGLDNDIFINLINSINFPIAVKPFIDKLLYSKTGVLKYLKYRNNIDYSYIN